MTTEEFLEKYLDKSLECYTKKQIMYAIQEYLINRGMADICICAYEF